jgi:hypothetical protein
MVPGEMHHARWMGKVIYSIKVWMFQDQFKLTEKESKALQDIWIFAVRVYVTGWFTAEDPVSAPNHDF